MEPVQAQTDSKMRKTCPRPDGMDSTYYDRYLGASPKRLAWALLRRDPKFQSECEAAGCSSADRAAVAARAHLRRFKHFKESYSSGKKPRFLPTSAPMILTCATQSLEGSVSIKQNQLAVIFDERYMRVGKQGLHLQLLLAEAAINDYFHGDDLAVQPKQLQVKATNILTLLQLLDLRAAQITPQVINQKVKRLVDCASQGRNFVNKTRRNLQQQAERFAKEGYLELVIVAGYRSRQNPKRPKVGISEAVIPRR